MRDFRRSFRSLALAQIKPPDEFPYAYIYKWRLQQEHHMKAKNGGKGMTDEQVERCFFSQ